MTFRSDASVAALSDLWQTNLADLSDVQIQAGTALCLSEHKASWFPTVPEFRRYATAQPRLNPKPEQIEWWFAPNPAGQEFAWHAGLRDQERNPVQRDLALKWAHDQRKRGVVVVQTLDPCPECHTGKGQPAIRQDGKPGPRLSVRCQSCKWSTRLYETMRLAISEWNR